MATIPQIRGMLLEEAVLQMLRTAGYTSVERAGQDPTLHDGHSGLEVRGRGEKHQTDAVADFRILQPFSNPHRLIVEAKCYSQQYPVGLPIVRNAVGVLKDISEWWVPTGRGNNATMKGRYHYQYAIFSASGYTPEAQRYAYAQDIYLIQYEKSRFIKPVIQAIRRLTPVDFGAQTWNAIDVSLKDLRRDIRKAIQNNGDFSGSLTNHGRMSIERILHAVSEIEGTIFAIAGGGFPIHLIPSPDVSLRELPAHTKVRIFWDNQSWYLEDERSRRQLFSFDIPPQLLDLYAEHGNLTRSRALDLKSEALDKLQAVLVTDGEVRLITFDLDRDWIVKVRDRIRQLPHKHEEAPEENYQ